MPVQEGLGSSGRADLDEVVGLALPVHFAEYRRGFAEVDRAKQVGTVPRTSSESGSGASRGVNDRENLGQRL